MARLLDLFCCAGGAAMGYHQAGFTVVGVDLVSQPHYPFPMYQDNAIAVLETLLAGYAWNGYTLADFDAIHASPECKGYTDCNLSPKEKYPRLIAPVRTLLEQSGKPYIIENVMGARPDMHNPIMLCATMFDLPMRRHRLFESNISLHAPCRCNHRIAHIGVYGHSVWDSWLQGTPRKDGRKRPDSVPLAIGRQAMSIDWMGIEELAEAIPPRIRDTWVHSSYSTFYSSLSPERWCSHDAAFC
jgi:DNA (cytosine-5)-methyltransferase 1